MDRELKFRVWDKYSGKSPTGGMHYFDAMEICDNGLFFRNSKFDLEQNHNDDKKAIVMQYTGIKDKNGNEIYEGDIMKIQLPVGGFWGNTPTEKIGVVRYESECGGFIVEWEYSKNQHHIILTCDIAHTGEVIGNTFQNPTLIKHS